MANKAEYQIPKVEKGDIAVDVVHPTAARVMVPHTGQLLRSETNPDNIRVQTSDELTAIRTIPGHRLIIKAGTKELHVVDLLEVNEEAMQKMVEVTRGKEGYPSAGCGKPAESWSVHEGCPSGSALISLENPNDLASWMRAIARFNEEGWLKDVQNIGDLPTVAQAEAIGECRVSVEEDGMRWDKGHPNEGASVYTIPKKKKPAAKTAAS